MIGIEEQLELLKLIGNELKSQIKCVVIGGTAMLFYGFKSATKDVDIVFLSENDRENFIAATEAIGFEKIMNRTSTDKKNPIIVERKNARMDLFLNEIVTFKLSPGIMSRIKQRHEFENLMVDVVSSDDIILLKCATDRAGDRKDALDIMARLDVNWDIIITESLWQTEHGRKAFSVYLFDFLEDLKDDYKAEIPSDVIRRMRKLAESEMVRVVGKKKIDDMARFSAKKK